MGSGSWWVTALVAALVAAALIALALVALFLLRHGRFMLYTARIVGARFWFRVLAHRIRERLGALQLTSLFLCPSHECNASCVHCYEKFPDKRPARLSTEQCKDLIDQFRRLGGYVAHFCSGEFLLRDDALELVRYSRDAGMFVVVTSNGLLVDEAKMDELVEAGLGDLVISIDSPDPARHDELRGVPGCFDRAVEALRIAHRKGITTQIWTYVTKSNSGGLDGIAELGRELGVTHTFVFFPLLSGHLFDRPEENLTFEEREELRRRFNGQPKVLLEFPTEKDLCRGGGYEHICVMPSGDVTFCPASPYSYGNIADRTLADCLRDIEVDFEKFCRTRCTGQCIVNFEEYRRGCNARFMHEDRSAEDRASRG